MQLGEDHGGAYLDQRRLRVKRFSGSHVSEGEVEEVPVVVVCVAAVVAVVIVVVVVISNSKGKSVWFDFKKIERQTLR